MQIGMVLRELRASNRALKAGISKRLGRQRDELSSRVPWLSLYLGGRHAPRVDIAETDSRMWLTAEVPGVDPANVTVACAGRSLIIEGLKLESKPKSASRVRKHRGERAYGAFRRAVRLPAEADGTRVELFYLDGVLHVSLHKTSPQIESSKARAPSEAPAPSSGNGARVWSAAP